METSPCMIPLVKSLQDCQAYRISPEDFSCRLVIVFDPSGAYTSLTYCVEIFDIGGGTPLHCHMDATEIFFILQGEGQATLDGKTVKFKKGDSILVPPTIVHMLENTGSTRLYVVDIMEPDENFAELIRSGTPVELDEEDMAVLCHDIEQEP
jgi:mannose-6-phosphate isomerase-like protein (cupin superfamily)